MNVTRIGILQIQILSSLERSFLSLCMSNIQLLYMGAPESKKKTQ